MTEFNVAGSGNYQLTQQTLIDTLLDEREFLLGTIEQLDAAFKAYEAGLKHYETAFVYGLNARRENYSCTGVYTTGRPEKGHAIRAMDCMMWKKLFDLVNMESILPAELRKEWDEAVMKFDVPEFTFDNIKSGLGEYLLNPEKYFAQKVDGVFQALSKTHVTNNPSGFRSRMIFADALIPNSYGLSPSIQTNFEMYLSDFIRIICNLCNYPEPPKRVAYDLLMKCYKHDTGMWHTVMGNMFRIRVYKKGTVHIEVNPELAAKLNAILATLYPLAIANQLRKSSTKAEMKEWRPIIKPIATQVLMAIKNSVVITPLGNSRFSVNLIGDYDKHVKREVFYVLEQVGFDKMTGEFDYNPREVITTVLETGLIPDNKSYQYYPTPEVIAQAATEELDAKPSDKILEPSAGTGDLLESLNQYKDIITALEIAPLRCSTLKAKGYHTICEDFLKHQGHYDKIIMNPPYSEGRWEAHIYHAMNLLNPKGRIVAVLPQSADVVPGEGHSVRYGKVFENEFRYTSINVKLVIVDKL